MRGFVYASIIMFAVLVQVSIIERISIAGSHLDLVLLACVSIALLTDSVVGTLVGFLAGLMLALTTATIIGPHAIVLAIIGYWCGRWGEVSVDRLHPIPPVIAALLATLADSFGVQLAGFILGVASSPSAMSWTAVISMTAFNIVCILPVYLTVMRIVGSPQFDPNTAGTIDA